MINSGIYSTKNIDLNLLIYVESLTLFCAFLCFQVVDNHDFIISKGFWLTVYIKKYLITPQSFFSYVYILMSKGYFYILLLHLELYFMKNSENNKSLLRRYLDDLYTMDDARKLLDELQTLEYDTDMLQDLAAEVCGRSFPGITADRP